MLKNEANFLKIICVDMHKECRDKKLKSNVFKPHKYHQMTKKHTKNEKIEKIKSLWNMLN
jgi:hypothetical protein